MASADQAIRSPVSVMILYMSFANRIGVLGCIMLPRVDVRCRARGQMLARRAYSCKMAGWGSGLWSRGDGKFQLPLTLPGHDEQECEEDGRGVKVDEWMDSAAKR